MYQLCLLSHIINIIAISSINCMYSLLITLYAKYVGILSIQLPITAISIRILLFCLPAYVFTYSKMLFNKAVHTLK